MQLGDFMKDVKFGSIVVEVKTFSSNCSSNEF